MTFVAVKCCEIVGDVRYGRCEGGVDVGEDVVNQALYDGFIHGAFHQ